ncbi:MAG: ANTAR domain-containing protein [Actinomycetota bacterium]|nr:ANTAR domain-containing protein [Actinomycetota bacterium]
MAESDAIAGSTVDSKIQSYLDDVESALAGAKAQVAQLEEALLTRTTIGQAVGLLMAQEGLGSEEAFMKLVHVSQNANIKLRDIAQRYVDAWEERVTGSKEA